MPVADPFSAFANAAIMGMMKKGMRYMMGLRHCIGCQTIPAALFQFAFIAAPCFRDVVPMRILLVEDHLELSRWLTKALHDAHLSVECAMNGADADALLHTQEYALVILDLTLPKMDGLEVLKRLRARGRKTPVLILTARGGLNERVQGLNLGADDYLAKPFELAELEARVKALLRRSQGGDAVTLVCGALSFDTVARRFTYGESALALTPREYAVLEVLLTRAGQVVSKEKLFDEVFTLDDEANLDAIEIYIHRLRKKLERAERDRVAITTLRGLGYMLQAQEPK
jgi:two-component system response regulator TctD